MRRLLCPFLIMAVLPLSSCATDDQPGQTEPVAPDASGTPYPEDPDMAKGDDTGGLGSAEGPTDGSTVGELTDDPFKKSAPTPPPSDDTQAEPLPEEPLPEPDTGEPYDGAFENGQPKYEPSPDGPDVTLPSDIANTDKTPSAMKGKTTRYVKGILVNVRAKPSSKSAIVRRLLGGAKIYVTSKGAWAKIRDGQWIRTKLLSSKPTRKASRAEADQAWQKSKYKDSWKPTK